MPFSQMPNRRNRLRNRSRVENKRLRRFHARRFVTSLPLKKGIYPSVWIPDIEGVSFVMSNHLPSKIMTLLREEFNFEKEAQFGTAGKEALIIVDIQNDFLPGGALAVGGGDEVIPVINQLQMDFDLVVLTQDWHPKDHLSFFKAHEGKTVFEEIELDGLPQMLWPDHCVQGTDGAAFSEKLDANRASLIIRKGTMPEIDSYSAFYDNGRRNSTGLTGYLMEKSVSKVTVCGLAGDYCVFFTAMDALHLGFDVDIRMDGTRAIDPASFEKKMKEFKDSGGRTV